MSGDRQLAEVESALSLLGGRHPEFVRAEREKAEATERRRRDLELASARSRKRAIRGTLIGTAIAVVVGTSAWFVRERYETRRRAFDGSAAVAQSFAALGFSETPRALWSSPDRIEEPLTAGTCAVAVGAAGGKPIAIEVTHDGDTLEAQGSFGFCTCANETVTVSAKGGDAAARSVRLLRIDARVFGSVLGFERSATRPASVDRCACIEEQLDGWLERSTSVLGPPDRTSMPAATRTELADNGLRVTRSVPGSTPIFPLSIPAGGCALVIASGATDTLSLRARGGARALEAAKEPIAVCSKSARVDGVWHEGPGTVTILEGDAARVGGRLGLRHVVQRVSLPLARTWIAPEDLSWDASLALALSQAPGAQTSELDATTKLPADARLLAFSLSPGARVEPATGADFVCEPTGPDLLATTMLCAQTLPQPWREATGKARVGVAHAPLPVWLKPLANANEAQTTVVALARLARRLRLQGFEATSLEAVTETATGAAVLGRAREDAVVAVTLQPSPPYALPLSAAAAWSLDGEPEIVPLGAGRKIALRSRVSPTGSEDARRTVVFRRAIGVPNK